MSGGSRKEGEAGERGGGGGGGGGGAGAGAGEREREREREGRTHHISEGGGTGGGGGGGGGATWSALEVTGGVRALAPALFRLQHLTHLYVNDNALVRLGSEVCLLRALHTLDASNNKLRALPAELGELTSLRELLLHNNYLRALPLELGRLFHLQRLTLHGNPLAQDLAALYQEPNGTHKLLTYMLDNLQVTAAQPPQRPWIPLTRPSRARPACIFTVMCYNVLCDKYATRQMYGYCPSWALDWDYRKKGILDEIRHYAADIISLQEVETEQFYNFFLPELKQDGYDGIFSPKSRAKTMPDSERKYVDGCAIFYRALKFSLVKEHLIEFNQLAMANSEGSDHMLNRVMPKDNIGLAALLETREAAWEGGEGGAGAGAGAGAGGAGGAGTQQPLVVCTAHIHWDPEFCDVKLVQTLMLTNELRAFVEEAAAHARTSTARVHLLLCGDFNSLPDSGVVEFLSSGRVASEHRDFKALGYGRSGSLRRLPGSEREFTHPFRLASAYAEHMMPYTNYTYDFKGIIDYVFYGRGTMTPLGLLGPLSADWLRDNRVLGCPHPHVPSDHFPLLVELELQPPASASASASQLAPATQPAPPTQPAQPPPTAASNR